jgi:hypothetical protein
MDNPPIKSVVAVFALFISLSLAWLVFGAIGFTKAVTSYKWPTTDGTVVSAQVVRPTGKSTKYIAEIGYSYQVGGKEYVSKKFKATSARGTSGWAKQVVEQHPVGSMVSVHYNPNKPQDAVLEPGLQSDNYWMTVAPLLIIALLAFALFQQIKNRNKQPDGLSTASP